MSCKTISCTCLVVACLVTAAPPVVSADHSASGGHATNSQYSRAGNFAKAQRAYDHGAFAAVAHLLGRSGTPDELLLQSRAAQAIRTGDANFYLLQASRKSQTPRMEVFNALAMLFSSRSAEAYNLMKPIYAKFPNVPEVMSTYGRCLCTMQQSEQGLELMRAARAKGPASAICADNLISAARTNFATADALKCLSQEISSKPYSVPLRLKRAIVYSESGRIKESLADFDAALKENPDCQYTYYQRATVYRNLQQFDKAIADLTRSEKCQDKDSLVSTRVLRLKVDCEDHSHHMQTATSDSQTLTDSYKGMKLSRGMRADVFHRVSLLEKQNDNAAALKAMEPLMHDFSDRSEVMTVQSRLLGKLKRYKESLAIADKLIARDNEMWEWHEIRGLALAGLGNKTGAEAELNKAQSLKAEYADLPTQLKDRIK